MYGSDGDHNHCFNSGQPCATKKASLEEETRELVKADNDVDQFASNNSKEEN